MNSYFKCTLCENFHHVLESLSSECLAAYKSPTEEEIASALENGYKQRKLCEQNLPTMTGFYRR